MKSIALLGFGTVGSGVYEIIQKNLKDIKDKYNINIDLNSILVKNLKKYKNHESFHLFTNSIDEIKKQNPDIIIEVMGGIEPAYSYVKYFLKNGSHVITANKDLIAECGEELMKIAKENNVSLMFEASVGGGIPILKPLKECLGGNKIESIAAIINGTTNFILSKMYYENMNYIDALSLAQDEGFAEADPTSDVEGLDASRKISILSSLAYSKKIDWKKIKTIGITDIDEFDIINAKSKKYKIKLLAISKQFDNDIYISVRPVYVPKNSSIGKIDNEFNGVVIDGDSVGNLMFYGKGAGKLPTASSIFGDLIAIIQNQIDTSNINLSNDYNLIENYPLKSSWVLRIDTKLAEDVTLKLLDEFNNLPIIINKSSDNKTLYITVNNFTENEILKKINNLEKNLVTVSKYFLIYE